jgi:hypothetical protein
MQQPSSQTTFARKVSRPMVVNLLMGRTVSMVMNPESLYEITVTHVLHGIIPALSG